MVWAILLLLIVVATYAIPKLGKALLVLLAILLLLAATGAVALYLMNTRDEAERKLAETRIKPVEVELVDLAVRPGHGTGSYTLIGRWVEAAAWGAPVGLPNR